MSSAASKRAHNAQKRANRRGARRDINPLPPGPTYEACNIHHLDYERYVEQPRRRGRDPVYDSLMAEALQQAHQHHKAAS